jgi:hypothetical protein
MIKCRNSQLGIREAKILLHTTTGIGARLTGKIVEIDGRAIGVGIGLKSKA